MKKIDELSEDTLLLFIDDYYNSEESVKKVIEKYEIDVKPSKVSSELPNTKVTFICPYCKVNMYEKALTRTEYKHKIQMEECKKFPLWNSKKNNIFCTECEHKDTKEDFYKYYCRCSNCNNLKEKQLEREKKEKEKRFNELIKNQEKNSSSIFDLYSVKDLSLLLCVLLYLHDDGETIKSVSKLKGIKFSPTQNNGFDYIDYMVKNGLLKYASTQDTFNHIEFKEDEKYLYERYLVDFNLNFSETEQLSISDIVNMCENIMYYDDIKDDALSMWKAIAKDELLQYLYYLSNKYNFGSDYIGDAIIEKLDIILEDFSVSEGMSILYNSVNGAASYKQTGITHKHAVNSINTYIANNIAKRKSGEWDTKSYKRNFDLPQSAISLTFFDNILKIGDKGFSSVPKKENIPAFYTQSQDAVTSDDNKTDYDKNKLLEELTISTLIIPSLKESSTCLEIVIIENQDIFIEGINVGLKIIDIKNRNHIKFASKSPQLNFIYNVGNIELLHDESIHLVEDYIILKQEIIDTEYEMMESEHFNRENMAKSIKEAKNIMESLYSIQYKLKNALN